MNKWTKESTRITPKNRTKTRTDWRKNEGVYYYLFSRWIHSDGSFKHEQVLAPGHVWWLFLFTYRVMALWLAETRCRKRERAVSRFLINSRFIHLIWRFYYNVSVNSYSQLSAYSKGNTHSTSRCKHVEQCHIWGDKTRAAYMSFGYVQINETTF